MSNLAIDAATRSAIVQQGTISSLIYLACCEDILSQKQALTALRAICLSSSHLIEAVKDGILDPLVLLSRNMSDIDLIRDISIFFNVLSTAPENRVQIAKRALIALVPLIMNSDTIIEQQATAAVANLMEDNVSILILLSSILD